MFQHMFELPDRMYDMDSINTLLLEFELFETFDVTSGNVAYVIIELLRATLERGIQNSEGELDYYEIQLLDYQSELDDYYDVVDFIALLNFFETYVPIAYEDVLDDFLYGPFDYQKMFALNDAYWLVYNAEFADEAWYEGNVYSDMFWYAYKAAWLADDTDIMDQILADGPYTDSEVLEPFFDLLRLQNSIYWTQWDIDYFASQIENQSNMLDVLENQHTLMLNTLTMVIDYFVLLSESMPLIAIEHLDELIDDGFLTPEEGFILKDALVDMLLDTLPGAADMSMLFLSMLYIGEAFGEVVVDDKALYADFLGLAGHASLDLGLTLASAVDLAFMNDVFAIADELMLPQEYVCYPDYWGPGHDYCFYESGGINPIKAIELAVLVGTFLDDFYVENEDKFLALEAIFSTPAGEAFVDLALETFLAEMEDSMSPHEYELFLFIFDEVMADLDTYKEGLAVLADIGVDLVDIFLLTEGLFFISLFELFESLDDMTDVVAFGYELEALLSLFLPYNDILMGARDAESVEKVLRMVRVPLLIGVLQEGMMDPEDFNDFFEDMIGPLASIISTLAELEVATLAYVESIDLTDWLFDERWVDYEFAMEVVVIITALVVVDEVIDEDMEDLILAAINTFFDDIFSHEVIMLLHGMDAATIDDFKDDVLQLFTDILEGARAIAALDFDDLTEADVDDIYDFLEGLEDFFGAVASVLPA
ncbi:MAG: hypothetical protein EA375_02125 [Acholeplasmataceae bacterium]|nr:MAG: hypothetical protein EA375_02125 [Acholeplasmataceae bacterium]